MTRKEFPMIRSIAMRSALCVLLAVALPSRSPGQTQRVQPLQVSTWQVYGAPTSRDRDSGVPGGGAIRIDPRPMPGEPWSSGAVMAISAPLQPRERITGLFWARAARPMRVTVTIQGGPPAYAALATARIHLGPAWRRYAIGGVSPRALPAGSQSLTIQAGRAPAALSLGPVAFLRGSPSRSAIARAFAGFRPAQIAEDVRIASDPGVALAGTLRLPGRAGHAPYPALILLAGNGPWSRGGYPLLVDRLTEAGIATLDYDKRGVGQSTGVFLDTIPLMERDAAAAAAYLRTLPDIDGRRIAILGMSQGGVVAPGVAAADPAIAAVVMLAGPAGEQGKLFLDEMRVRLIAGGTRPEAVEPILAATAPFMEARAAAAAPAAIAPLERRLADAFVGGGWTREQATGFVATLGNPVVVSQYRVAASETLARIRAPVLALYAGDDTVVSTAHSLPEARLALRANADATVIEVPHMNHTFQRLETGAAGTPEHVGPSVSDPATLDLITAWLVARLLYR
jgi:pimeloyl-ACP methyl ester carboxylesterase